MRKVPIRKVPPCTMGIPPSLVQGSSGRSSSCSTPLVTGKTIMDSRKMLCKMALLSLEGQEEELSIDMNTGYFFRLANWTIGKERLCGDGERQG